MCGLHSAQVYSMHGVWKALLWNSVFVENLRFFSHLVALYLFAIFFCVFLFPCAAAQYHYTVQHRYGKPSSYLFVHFSVASTGLYKTNEIAVHIFESTKLQQQNMNSTATTCEKKGEARKSMKKQPTNKLKAGNEKKANFSAAFKRIRHEKISSSFSLLCVFIVFLLNISFAVMDFFALLIHFVLLSLLLQFLAWYYHLEKFYIKIVFFSLHFRCSLWSW